MVVRDEDHKRGMDLNKKISICILGSLLLVYCNLLYKSIDEDSSSKKREIDRNTLLCTFQGVDGTVYDWGWGRFLRITFFKPIGQTCEGRCGTWFFNKSHGIYPGDHFAKMSLHAFQSLFSKVDFSKVAQ